MENKLISKFETIIEERVSKKGKVYKMVVAVVNGTKFDITFLTDEFEFALFKAGIRTR